MKMLVAYNEIEIMKGKLDYMVRIAVCDDAAEDREQLTKCCRAYCLQNNRDCNMLEYYNGENLMYELEESPDSFDLIFLDILMSGINGMETAKAIRKHNPTVPVIFLTGSPDFAVESYDVEAFSYLLKPICKEQINKVMDKYFQKYEDSSRYFILKKSGYIEKVSHSDILYFESRGNKVILYSNDGKQSDFYDKLDHVEQMINSKTFLRCHQSYLVNMAQIHSADTDFILKDGRKVPIKVRERKALRDKYFQFVLQEGGRRSL